MAQVKVVVNGRSFRMGCKDGEEGRVQNLATEIDGHVQRIKNGTKAVQDERLFLMAALLMADQLWEAREEIQRLQRMALDPRAYQVIDGGVQAMQRELNKAMDRARAGAARQGNRLARDAQFGRCRHREAALPPWRSMVGTALTDAATAFALAIRARTCRTGSVPISSIGRPDYATGKPGCAWNLFTHQIFE